MVASDAIQPGNVAVITGAGSGIGAACARLCALRYSMRVVLLDVDQDALAETASRLSDETMETVLDIPCDVTSLTEWQAVRERVWSEMGGCHFLFLNAGIGGGGSQVLRNSETWQNVFNVNVFGVLHGMQVFVPEMIGQNVPAVVATTASRVAFTNPPGDPAYNASKSAVVAIAESLQHHLRGLPKCLVESWLLLPGFTRTQFLYNSIRRKKGEAFAQHVPPSKFEPGPSAASPEYIATLLLESIIDGGPFYVVGEDEDMTSDQFNVAARWSAEDLIHRRPPLSRWLEPHRSEFLAKL